MTETTQMIIALIALTLGLIITSCVYLCLRMPRKREAKEKWEEELRSKGLNPEEYDNSIIIKIRKIKIYIQNKKAEKERHEQEELEGIRRELELERRQREKEQQEKKQQAELERNMTCLICEKLSNSEIFCKNCWDRSKVLKNELPKDKINTYEKINGYKSELMFNIINSEQEFNKKTDSIKLLSIAEILKNKYFEEDAFIDTYEFLKDVHDGNDFIIEKYNLKKLEKKELTLEYKCKDGDIVKSKGEREIDNFLFDNRIWHIYEKQYIHPETKKTAKPDFYLPDYNLYIEYFGISNDENYLRSKDYKIKMYQSDKSINFEYLTFEDDNCLFDKLKIICQKYHIPVK